MDKVVGVFAHNHRPCSPRVDCFSFLFCALLSLGVQTCLDVIRSERLLFCRHSGLLSPCFKTGGTECSLLQPRTSSHMRATHWKTPPHLVWGFLEIPTGQDNNLSVGRFVWACENHTFRSDIPLGKRRPRRVARTLFPPLPFLQGRGGNHHIFSSTQDRQRSGRDWGERRTHRPGSQPSIGRRGIHGRLVSHFLSRVGSFFPWQRVLQFIGSARSELPKKPGFFCKRIEPKREGISPFSSCSVQILPHASGNHPLPNRRRESRQLFLFLGFGRCLPTKETSCTLDTTGNSRFGTDTTEFSSVQPASTCPPPANPEEWPTRNASEPWDPSFGDASSGGSNFVDAAERREFFVSRESGLPANRHPS